MLRKFIRFWCGQQLTRPSGFDNPQTPTGEHHLTMSVWDLDTTRGGPEIALGFEAVPSGVCCGAIKGENRGMRMIFGVLSLLIVVAVVGVLAKRPYGALVSTAPSVGTPAYVSSPQTTPQKQVQQLQNQISKSVEDALLQTRPEAENK
jgi:hypothetical protein